MALAEWAGERDLDFRHDPASCNGAVFSRCGSYRYLLWRMAKGRGRLLSIGMLNPSTADEMCDDPTIARCRSLARRGGYSGVLVWNLFAWRATDPADLRRADEPVGPENDAAMALALDLCRRPLLAWGNHGRRLGRSAEVLGQLATRGTSIAALGLTKAGEPRHPLYMSASAMPQRWRKATCRPASSP